MKSLNKLGVILIIVLTLVAFAGCQKNPTTAAPTIRDVKVTKGTVETTVTGTATLALAKTQDLSFETAGTVDVINVDVGSTVTKDQVLVTLDSTTRDAQLDSLQKTLTSAEKNLTAKQTALTTAQRNLANKQKALLTAQLNSAALQKALVTAQRNLTAKQTALVTAQRNLAAKQAALPKAQRAVDARILAKQQADLDLLSAQNNLNQITDVKNAQDSINKAQLNLDTIQATMFYAVIDNPASAPGWAQMVTNAKAELSQSQANLKSILSGTNISVSSSTVIQLSKAQLQIKQSQMAADDAQQAIADAQTAVTTAQYDIDAANTSIANAQYDIDDANTAIITAQSNIDQDTFVAVAQLDINDANTAISSAQSDIVDAQSAIVDAQNNIDTTNQLSLEVKAPFNGFVTTISVKGGDAVQKGKVALQIADPNQFKANFMVSETDIFSVKVGQAATVSVDALSGQVFPARITAIAPLATSSQGVVNYQVTTELSSLIPANSSSAASGNFTRPTNLPAGITPGGTNLPSGLPNRTFPSGFTPGTLPTNLPADAQQRFTGRAAGQSDNTTSSQAVTLKQGLTTSVTIIIQQVNNVLIVPNRAITKTGGNSAVQLVNGTTTETRVVQTGLSDATNTEITSGLNESDVVQVKSATASTSNNAFRAPGAGGVGIIQQAVR